LIEFGRSFELHFSAHGDSSSSEFSIFRLEAL
jgi:hypothetical protein